MQCGGGGGALPSFKIEPEIIWTESTISFLNSVPATCSNSRQLWTLSWEIQIGFRSTPSGCGLGVAGTVHWRAQSSPAMADVAQPEHSGPSLLRNDGSNSSGRLSASRMRHHRRLLPGPSPSATWPTSSLLSSTASARAATSMIPLKEVCHVLLGLPRFLDASSHGSSWSHSQFKYELDCMCLLLLKVRWSLVKVAAPLWVVSDNAIDFRVLIYLAVKQQWEEREIQTLEATGFILTWCEAFRSLMWWMRVSLTLHLLMSVKLWGRKRWVWRDVSSFSERFTSCSN